MAAAPKIAAAELQKVVNEEERPVQALVDSSVATPGIYEIVGASWPCMHSLAYTGEALYTSGAVYRTPLVQVGPAVSIEDDFHGWLLEQAAALRNRNSFSLDWEHLAEELEAMAAVDRRELLSRLTTVYEHLLKFQFQPKEVPKRGRGWRVTLTRSRTEINRLLEQSPGLRGQLEQFASEAYRDARRPAGQAAGLRKGQWDKVFPEHCPWTLAQTLEFDFPPSADNDSESS
jgi:hypothetical protein